MRTPFFILILCIPMIAAPASAQGLLGRLARRAAEGAAQDLAGRAVTGASQPRTKKVAKQAPAAEFDAESPQPDPASSSGPALVVKNDMPVMSSDGVKVAVVNHVPGNARAYGPDEMFFTADPYYRLRRIYGREVSVSGGTVRLKMTAAQYRARNQNPD